MESELKIEHWPIDRLIPYVRNPRKNDAQVDRMVGVFKEFGVKLPLLVKSDGTIIDGHLRLKAARRLGLQNLPVVTADDLSEAQIKAFRLLANKSVEWAEWDNDLLRGELEELQAMAFDLALTGFDPATIDDLLQEEREPGGSDEEDENDGTAFGNLLAKTIHHPGWNKKRSIRFLSIRRWSTLHKKKQIGWMREVKACFDGATIREVAGEFMQSLCETFGNLADILVTAPPTNRENDGRHFATALARSVAEGLGAQYFQLFALRDRKVKPDSKHYGDRVEPSLIEVPGSTVLLIDDVATTGLTIERCANLCMQSAMVIPIVWFYEDLAGDEACDTQ